MTSMRDVRIRIKSVKETMQITRAMDLIASSKLKKARKQLNEMLPYFEKTQTTLKDIIAHSPEVEHIYFNKREKVKEKMRGYVVISADKGLCGSYNHNVVKFAEEHMGGKENKYLFIIGQMGRDFFRRKNYVIDVECMYTAQNPTMLRAREIADTLISMYKRQLLDEIYVIYTKMHSSVKQYPEIIKLLPLEKTEFHNNSERFIEQVVYEPSPSKVLDILIPNYLKGLIFGTLVESFCSEQAARMAAMNAATKSAKELIKKLTLLYNRARQAAITQELSEIVGGAEALK